MVMICNLFGNPVQIRSFPSGRDNRAFVSELQLTEVPCDVCDVFRDVNVASLVRRLKFILIN